MRDEVKDIREELKQLIQSRLPVKEAARTSVLSKSWLHAWSTIPTLRFCVLKEQKDNNMTLMEEKKDYSMTLMDVDHTLKRYLRDKITIEKFDLKIDIDNQKSTFDAKNWIETLATKTCLKDFSISVNHYGHDSTFWLPDELLLGEKITKIRVQSWRFRRVYNSVMMMTSHHPVIKCVSLQELYLNGVKISEEALNEILSSCTLLVKIELIKLVSSKEFKTIKVKNLPRLYELRIVLNTSWSPALEISDVPNLRVFGYEKNNNELYAWETSEITEPPDSFFTLNANAHSMSLSKVMKLVSGGVVPDYACLDMITSGLCFLESLTLDLETWKFGSFHFTCASIKIFSLTCGLNKNLSDIQVHAPKLLSFSFIGNNNIPDLLFPVSSLRQIELSLTFQLPVDASFFLKMREALTLSPKCDIRI